MIKKSHASVFDFGNHAHKEAKISSATIQCNQSFFNSHHHDHDNVNFSKITRFHNTLLALTYRELKS